MKNTLLASGLILGLIALIGGGGYYYIQQSFEKSEGITSIAEDLSEQQEEPKIEELSEEPKVSSEVEMKEAQVQEYFHHMTHQKVEADKKWGAVKMTPENIESLLVIVKANQDKYEHGEYYRTILEEWQAGNFENAVSVHNFVWQLKGGTVGRATGLLDEAEERAFIEERFKD
ncbi:DUF6241 domain-containing protein [Planococcus shixiaomingii]|uniref:DUF6241 domain-containing protein n=1 Tax=Planococcus shixiaomingii TaxID=3058393 RepID=UPI002631FADA|nr:DUF6241 domain-containing protein [Planococcus sp. N022]WKA55856.1 DUF6241 domain-containing protein [Planococcus sp. N022]